MPPVARVNECAHPERKHYAHGLCSRCYYETYHRVEDPRPYGRANECGHPERRHWAKGMCRNCYRLADARAHGVRERGSGWARVNECGHPERKHSAKGMCRQCYRVSSQRKAAELARRRARGVQPRTGPRINECGHPERKHRALGMCSTCWDAKRRRANGVPSKDEGWARVNECGHPEREHVAYGMCPQCYRQRPTIKAQIKAYSKEHRSRPETKAWRVAYRSRLDVRRAEAAAAHHRRTLGECPPLHVLGERVGWICGHASTGGCLAPRKKIDPSLPGSHRYGATYEHIIPVSAGGTNDPRNLTVAHNCCNTSKGNRATIQMLLLTA